MRNRAFYPYISIILSLQLFIYSVPPVYSASPILLEDQNQASQSTEKVQPAITSKVPSGSLGSESQPLSAATAEGRGFIPGSKADTTAPSIPGKLQGRAVSSTQINLTWNASTDSSSGTGEASGVAGYRVYRDGVLMKVKTGPSEEDKNLKPNTTYSYQIQAIDKAGNVSALSAAVKIKTPALADTQAPASVTNLKGAAVSSTQINLSWTASTDNTAVKGYRVYRNGAQVADIPATTYQDKNLTSNAIYNYEVRAYDAAGNVSSVNPAVQIKALEDVSVPQPQPADTVEIPGALLNADEIAGIKAKIAAGEEPWKSAYQRLISKANAALAEAAPSVTFQGFSETGQSENVYNTMRGYHWGNNKENMPADCSHPAEYRCDGQLNPLADRADLAVAQAWSENVLVLAQAYAFSGDKRYAQKAVEMIRVWAVDPETRMVPVLPSNAIEIFETFQGALYGADLIRNYSGWNAAEKEAFNKWVQTLSDAAERRTWQNNWENERWVFVALAANLTGDTQALNNMFDKYKEKLSAMIGPKGEMLLELSRTKSLDYSMLALGAMTRLAEIARHHGVDLYTYTVEGRNLELAWDFHVPYLLEPSKWPWEQIVTYKGSFTFLYEIAYLREHKASYLDVINKYQRPMEGGCMMGQVTLTHAYGAYAAEIDSNPAAL